jgi:hypothetical protein
LASTAVKFNVALESDASSLPIRIKEIIAHGFQLVGWDSAKKRLIPSAASKFTLAGFKAALNEILNEIINWSPAVMPTKQELESLSLACSKLWDLDIHRLVPDRDYKINIQRGKCSMFII